MLNAPFPSLVDAMRRENGEQPKGVASTHFERKSIKFWVRSHDVTKVICEIVKHMPIYSFGKLHRFSQKTTSVYYDDDNLSMYALRLVKEENSTLIRFRWYNELAKDTVVFVERKVHHESWVMANSNKMRFKLNQDQILSFIQGRLQPTAEFLAENPMFVEVQQMIVNDGLHPCLQTRYNRSAFQMDDDDSTRLSLDTNLMMLKESGVDPSTDWHKKEYEYLENDVHRFPFAVLEIKLHTHLLSNPPGWIRELMHSGLLIRVDKFSKYAHGVAILYRGIVTTLPYWLDEKFSADMENEGDGDNYDDDDDDLLRDSSHQANNLKTSIYSKATGTLKNYDPVQFESASQPLPEKSFKDFLLSLLNFSKFLKGKDTPGLPKVEKRLRIEPKTFFANERTYLQWFNAATVMGSVSIAMMGVQDNPDSQALGMVFLPLAMIITIYSLIVYHWRTEKLIRRDPSTTYSDRWGPTALTIIFLCVLTAGIAYTGDPLVVDQTPLEVNFDKGLRSEMARCSYGDRLSKFPQAQFRPSGAVYLNGLLYVSGGDGRISQIDFATNQTTTIMKSLWLPPAGPLDIEGLATLPLHTGTGRPAAMHPLSRVFRLLSEATIGESLPPPGSMLYASVESPAMILEIDVENRNVTRIFDLSDLIPVQPNSGLDGYRLPSPTTLDLAQIQPMANYFLTVSNTHASACQRLPYQTTSISTFLYRLVSQHSTEVKTNIFLFSLTIVPSNGTEKYLVYASSQKDGTKSTDVVACFYSISQF